MGRGGLSLEFTIPDREEHAIIHSPGRVGGNGMT